MCKAIYFPHPDDDLICRISDRVPCQAEAVRIEDSRADLEVIDHLGHVHLVPNVLIGMGEADYCVLA
jgi:hypothetical protein